MRSLANTSKVCREGMTLMEILVVLAIILMLVGAVITAGKVLQERANIDLTRSLFEVLDTALQQYYDDFGQFPFDTPDTNANGVLGDDYVVADLIVDFTGVSNGGTVNVMLPVHQGVNPLDPAQTLQVSSACDIALFYFLNTAPNSRRIAAAVAESLVTNRDTNNAAITFTFMAPPKQTIDLPRYIDPWKTSIRYVYVSGTAFPVLTSAGPDKVFGTGDDITNK